MTHKYVDFVSDDDFLECVEKVVESYPDDEGQHPLFKKFDVRTGGLYDTWIYTKDWNQLSETEKWKYVALCALSWKKQYEYWLEKEEYNRIK